jgi:hypothetical protein
MLVEKGIKKFLNFCIFVPTTTAFGRKSCPVTGGTKTLQSRIIEKKGACPAGLHWLGYDLKSNQL